MNKGKKGQMDIVIFTGTVVLIAVIIAIVSVGIAFNNDRIHMEELVTVELVCADSEIAYSRCMDEVGLNPGCQNYVYDLKKTCNNFRVSIEDNK